MGVEVKVGLIVSVLSGLTVFVLNLKIERPLSVRRGPPSFTVAMSVLPSPSKSPKAINLGRPTVGTEN